MSKITIILKDTEDGHVSVDVNPRMEKLVEIAKGGDITPAEGYAMAALAKIRTDAIKATEEDVKAKGLILPSEPRLPIQ